MAEPQGTEQEKITREGVKVGQTGAQGVQGEARTFKEGDSAKTGTIARAGAEAGRQVAEAGRLAGQGVADVFGRTLDPFLAFQMDMNRWFDDLWRQTTGFGLHAPLRTARPLSHLGAASLFGLPPADFKETGKTYELAVELPGLTREDIDLSLKGGTLTIRGQKSEETEDTQASYHVSERRFGRFDRSFPVPDDVDPARVEATFRDGVLRISLPKIKEAAERQSRIPIK